MYVYSWANCRHISLFPRDIVIRRTPLLLCCWEGLWRFKLLSARPSVPLCKSPWYYLLIFIIVPNLSIVFDQCRGISSRFRFPILKSPLQVPSHSPLKRKKSTLFYFFPSSFASIISFVKVKINPLDSFKSKNAQLCVNISLFQTIKIKSPKLCQHYIITFVHFVCSYNVW